jgi:dCTP deaminase
METDDASSQERHRVELVVIQGGAMTILSDIRIRNLVDKTQMIEPFEPEQVKEVNGSKVISYGTSSYGYDVRCAPEWKVFTNTHSVVVDPKAFSPLSFVDIKGDHCIIPPNSFALARSLEYFRIPRDILVICLGKSTYARCGIIVNVTHATAGQGVRQ